HDRPDSGLDRRSQTPGRHGSMDVFRCNWDTGRSLLTKPIVIDPLVRSFRGLAVRLLVFIGLCLAATPALGKDLPVNNANFFETKIRPVLAGTCSKCHGARKATNGLRVDSRAALITGGKHGPAVVAGDPEGSLLIRAVRYTGERKMPPDKQLPTEVVADLERWIELGAFWPET